MSNGLFITFEGGEGVGKSTNIEFCAEWLKTRGIDVVVTREPGGTPIAEQIREDLLKAHHPEPMDDLAELLLMFAARSQHISNLIRPALARGTWVLCDRFTDSTIAYQGFARGQSMERILMLKTLVQAGLEPDCTFLLEAPPEIGMARARGRADTTGTAIDRFETEQLAFFQRVKQGFDWVADEYPSRVKRIDAVQALDGVRQQLLQHLQGLLAEADV